MFDLLIKNGKIIDGTGSPSYFADIAIKDGKIVKIGKGLSGASEIIDATGLCVTPGFIDSHSHSDANLLSLPDMREKVEQGITFSIGGQCGGSIVPLGKNADPKDYKIYDGIGSEYELRSDPEKFFAFMKEHKLGSGLALLIGHGSIRRAVMGMENRAPTAEELEKMKSILRKCMDLGALGLSFGLFYAPGSYSKTDEAIEIAKVVAEYDGVIAAHIRSESEYYVKAVNEFITIAREAGVRGVMSHQKACSSSENWGKVTYTMRLMEQANADGVDVYCDVYPYVASNTSLSATFLPNKELSRGTDEIVRLLDDPEYRARMHKWNEEKWGTDYGWTQITASAIKEYSGLRIPEIAKKLGKDDIDTVLDIMRDCRLSVSACYFTMCEEDLMHVMSNPRAMICTDSGVASPDAKAYHPRLRGSFPRALGRYVRERKVVSLSEMIRKMTAMPARVYGLKTKGLIWENMDADICIFDENTIADKCTFTDCKKKAEGLYYVLVAGEVVVRDAEYLGKRNARFVTFR